MRWLLSNLRIAIPESHLPVGNPRFLRENIFLFFTVLAASSHIQ